jgi:putative oxidoreductase
MNWKTLLFPSAPSTRASVGLLVLRVVAGGAMASHGWGKIQNPFHWMDGAPSAPPAVLQFLAALSEFGGGLALVAGVVTVVAAAGIFFTMAEALRHHVGAGDPFGKWELALLYFVIAVVMLTAGPGQFSVDALLRSRAVKS